MSDDDRDPEKIINAAPLFDKKYDARPSIAEQISSREDAVNYLNKKFAIIIINGKFRILREKNNDEIELMDKKDFISLHDDKRMQVAEGDKSKSVPITEMWLKSQNHRIYEYGITFDPSQVGHYAGKYNLWKGYNILPVEADCGLFLDFMRDVICAGNTESFKFLLDVVADMFQRPWDKPGIVVVIRGEEGVGKSFFVEKLAALMSGYSFSTSNPTYVFGDFNGHLKNVILLHLEEAIYAGSKKEESLLKHLITGPNLAINDKFQPSYEVPWHGHIFITGNPDRLMAVSLTARRPLMLHVSPARMRDIEYFHSLNEWFTSGGKNALLHYFMNHKYDRHALHIIPNTDELVEQKKLSLSPVHEYAMSIVANGNMPYGEPGENGGVKVIKVLLYQDFCKSPLSKKIVLSDRQFGIQFVALFPEVVDGVAQKSSNGRTITMIKGDQKCRGAHGERLDAYTIPDLVTCRALMDYNLSGKSEWDNKVEWTILRPNTDELGDIRDKKPF